MSTVWFIRHAESEGNIGLATDHPAYIKLTPKGIEQSHFLASTFEREPDLIITSPYQRTLYTAQPIIERFPYAKKEEWSVQEFTYLVPIDTLTSRMERKPKANAFWERYDPLYVDGDDAESFGAFIARVRTIVIRLKQTRKDFIAVFSHEQFINAIIWLSQKGKMDPTSVISSTCMKEFRNFLREYPLPNAAILPVQLYDNGKNQIGDIMTSHLYINSYGTYTSLETTCPR